MSGVRRCCGNYWAVREGELSGWRYEYGDDQVRNWNYSMLKQALSARCRIVVTTVTLGMLILVLIFNGIGRVDISDDADMSRIPEVLEIVGVAAGLGWLDVTQQCMSADPSCWEEAQRGRCDSEYCWVSGLIAGGNNVSGIAGGVGVKGERLGSGREASLVWLNEFLLGSSFDQTIMYLPPMESRADDVKLVCTSLGRYKCLDGRDSYGWTYSGRFGNHVFSIRYGSESVPISRDNFIENYVTNFENFVIEHMT